jgi:hypothetical protein
MELNDYIYVVNEYGKFLRKVTWKGQYNFEWKSGWAPINKLSSNPDKKSKIKFILNQL